MMGVECFAAPAAWSGHLLPEGPVLRRCPVLLVVVVCLTALVAACGHGATRSPSALVPGANAVVVREVDGDTIRARVGRHEERVRFIGIDTPETKDPRKPVQCFGREAAARTAHLLPRGTPLRLVRDVEERDRYGRLLAYVYRARDDLFVNLALAREGYAVTLTYPPNVAHVDELAAAVAEARAADRGLWSACGGPGLPAP